MRTVAFLEVVSKGDTVRHFKALRFYSDDAYIVNELLGE